MESRIVPVAFLSFVMMLEAQMVCWQALMRCHEERDCELAYSQYLSACDGNIRLCPSHCISALIRLNQTANGPFLETCDCGSDPECLRAKRAVEPCLPRTHPGDADGIGCMEARQRCEDEPSCQSSLTAYLSHCGQLFNGRKGSSRCRATIEDMVKLCSIGDNSVSIDHDGTDDAYEDEDYEVKPESEGTDADAVPSVTRSQQTVLLCIAFALAFTL
ncbi:growth arrest-specific protein 1-like [Sinocyclocheilus anshuiensis]|nr:PREDICTED: growth arrest-specific protein 1-like [Sinocyclocheilus anshuiensis]